MNENLNKILKGEIDTPIGKIKIIHQYINNLGNVYFNHYSSILFVSYKFNCIMQLFKRTKNQQEYISFIDDIINMFINKDINLWNKFMASQTTYCDKCKKYNIIFNNNYYDSFLDKENLFCNECGNNLTEYDYITNQDKFNIFKDNKVSFLNMYTYIELCKLDEINLINHNTVSIFKLNNSLSKYNVQKNDFENLNKINNIKKYLQQNHLNIKLYNSTGNIIENINKGNYIKISFSNISDLKILQYCMYFNIITDIVYYRQTKDTLKLLLFIDIEKYNKIYNMYETELKLKNKIQSSKSSIQNTETNIFEVQNYLLLYDGDNFFANTIKINDDLTILNNIHTTYRYDKSEIVTNKDKNVEKLLYDFLQKTLLTNISPFFKRKAIIYKSDIYPLDNSIKYINYNLDILDNTFECFKHSYHNLGPINISQIFDKSIINNKRVKLIYDNVDIICPHCNNKIFTNSKIKTCIHCGYSVYDNIYSLFLRDLPKNKIYIRLTNENKTIDINLNTLEVIEL